MPPGPAALARVNGRSDIDLVLTDVMLPRGMSGRQVAEAVQEHSPRARVVCTSGYAENVIHRQGKLDQSVTLLAKPYRNEDLLRVVRSVLDKNVE